MRSSITWKLRLLNVEVVDVELVDTGKRYAKLPECFQLLLQYSMHSPRREMYCGLCVCLCPRPHAYTIARTQM